MFMTVLSVLAAFITQKTEEILYCNIALRVRAAENLCMCDCIILQKHKTAIQT